MKQTLHDETHPIFVLEINRNETGFRSIGEIVDYLKQQIEAHELARFIGIFDHYGHTRSLHLGHINPDIVAAQNLLFCFGLSLPEPSSLALRPRSLGVAETTTGFVLSFLESPMPVANLAMETWAKSIANRQAA